MTSRTEDLLNLIYNRLKNYKSKEIFLEKEIFRKFIISLIKEN